MAGYFEGRNVLVTGGTGSIGSGIVERMLEAGPKVIRIYSRDEFKQKELKEKYKYNQKLRFFIGDVRDLDRLEMAFENVDVVFHTAALKQVDMCEYNPFEAIKTNVLGTQNVISAAMKTNVDKVIFISTDKAVNPINTMGASKLLAEKLILDANFFKGNRRTVFSCARFGNILGSRASVIPLFIERIKNGLPLQVTNPEMTRFVTPIRDAVDAIFKAAEYSHGWEVFIPKMPVVKLADLISVIIEEFAPKFGRDPKEIKTEKTGMRQGEKMHESLIGEEEAKHIVEMDNLIVLSSFKLGKFPNSKPSSMKVYCSKDLKPLDRNGIKSLLQSANILP